MAATQTQGRTQSATVQKLVDSGQNSLADFVTSIVAAANGQYSEFGVDDVVTFRIRDVSANRAGIVGNYFVEYFVEDATESFRQEVVKSYNAAPASGGCCGGACNTSVPPAWSVTVRPSTKGLNIPKKALDYLAPDRNQYTPLYVRPLEGSTDKFLVNATAGQGACWEVYANKDGRYIINATIQRKAFSVVIGRKPRLPTFANYTPDTWTVTPNGSTGNSVIFQLS